MQFKTFFRGLHPLRPPLRGAQSIPQTPQLHLGELTHACSLHLISQLEPYSPNCNFLVNALPIGIILVDVLQNWLNRFRFPFLEGGLLVTLIDRMIFLSPFLDVTRMSMSPISFLAQLDSGILCLQNAFLWPMILVALSLELTDIFWL